MPGRRKRVFLPGGLPVNCPECDGDEIRVDVMSGEIDCVDCGSALIVTNFVTVPESPTIAIYGLQLPTVRAGDKFCHTSGPASA